MKSLTNYEVALDRAFRNAFSSDVKNHLAQGVINGNYYILPDTDGLLENAMKQDNLFRKYGTLVNVNAEDKTLAVLTSTGKAEIVGDNVGFHESEDDYKELPFGAYKITSLSKLNVFLIDDGQFDVVRYLKKEFARRFARAEENAILNGTGKEEPLGVLKSAEVGAATSNLSYDDIVKLYFSVNAEYRKNGVWIMSDETALKLRTLKDKNGNYLWNFNNDTVFGKEVVTSAYMSNAAVPVLFGDLSFIWILIRSPLAVRVLSEKYILRSEIGYAGNERFDVKLIRPDAVKLLKVEQKPDTKED